LPSFCQRLLDHRRPARRCQDVEHDKSGRCFSRELANTAFGGMKAHLQRVKGKVPVNVDHQLTIDDESIDLNVLEE
jgi:hypothetical protein